MTTDTPGKFNFTPEQRQLLAEAYRLILSWRQKRIRAQAAQQESVSQVTSPQPISVSIKRED
jgi:hypothetical protein